MTNTSYSFRDREISDFLIKKNINYLEDLTTERMAKKLGIYVEFQKGDSYVRSVSDFAMIYIEKRLEHFERRREFFHEVTHVLYHPGDQMYMPKALSIYQEEQTKYLMLYLSMPIHIIEPILLKHPTIESLQEMFDLPEDMIKDRLEMLRRERMRATYQTKIQKHEWRYRKKSLQPGEVHDCTIEILKKLKKQVGQERISRDVPRLL